MCYYFWGIKDEPIRGFVTDPLSDWAWAEWVEAQGIGE